MYKILSLFGNVGVGEMLLDKSKFKTVVYNEIDPKRAKFYKHFFPDVILIVGDVSNPETKQEIISTSIDQQVDFIMASPPCQTFSLAGKRNKNDPRHNLTFDMIEVIKKVKPKYVFIENVPQYYNDKIKGKTALGWLVDNFLDEYNFHYGILDTKNYGVPQERKRMIITLSKKTVPNWYLPYFEEKIITVRDAIGHLPSLDPLDGKPLLETGIKHHKRPLHNLRHIQMMAHTPTGRSAHHNPVHYPKRKDGTRIKGFATTYKRMSWDKPAPTITSSNGSISSQNNVHPGTKYPNGLYSDPRVLSLRELFILMTLPADWDYPEWASDNFVRKVVGEGIPPLFVKKIFDMIEEVPNA